MSKKETASEQAALAQQTALAGSASRKADYEIGVEKKLLEKGLPMLDAPVDFFEALMSGDRDTLSRMYATQLEDITSQTQNFQNQLLSSGQLGGELGMLSELANLQAGQQRASLLAGAPAQGAGALTDIATGLMGQGTNLAQAGTGSLGAGNQALGNILDWNVQYRQIPSGWSQVGHAFANIGGQALGAWLGNR